MVGTKRLNRILSSIGHCARKSQSYPKVNSGTGRTPATIFSDEFPAAAQYGRDPVKYVVKMSAISRRLKNAPRQLFARFVSGYGLTQLQAKLGNWGRWCLPSGTYFLRLLRHAWTR
ncbi:hypothetical protein KCP74_13340 [Salmonella enterica subsp. enterica]|nr:hypothetical protein KCP74_13340 [Salmonella enterica subsp. enterica]